MFGLEVEAAARAHALADFPKESCGLVIDGAYLPIENVAADPVADFAMPRDAWTAHGEVQGVIHSHGAAAALAPSASDMQHQIASAIPWGITRTDGVAASPVMWWGDHRLDDPLLGREFIHGVTDCYSAIRSWRWQRCGIKLIDFPRDQEWWTGGYDHYRDGFAQAGYRQIDAADAAVGDVVLMTFRSKVPNHGGTIVEDGLLYHHLERRLSCREPLGRYRNLITHWLRYEG